LTGVAGAAVYGLTDASMLEAGMQYEYANFMGTRASDLSDDGGDETWSDFEDSLFENPEFEADEADFFDVFIEAVKAIWEAIVAVLEPMFVDAGLTTASAEAAADVAADVIVVGSEIAAD